MWQRLFDACWPKHSPKTAKDANTVLMEPVLALQGISLGAMTLWLMSVSSTGRNRGGFIQICMQL